MSPEAKKRIVPLERRLVLADFLLGEFGLESFEAIAQHLREGGLEGVDPDGISRFCKEVMLRRASPAAVEDATLLLYDERILRHTDALSTSRGEDLRWKYFQYLALLVTERYLERWFSDREALRTGVDAHIDAFNKDLPKNAAVPACTDDDLRKFAYWCATGSGKTLLMHANILQFRDHAERAGAAAAVDRVVLLTPNEGLSRQHLAELETSGIGAELFSKDAASLFSAQNVEIIDIQKLRETEGEKTVAVDAFEGRNLVLVDEGHRGASGEAWMGFRDRLSEDGFSFEYSATFGQSFGKDTKLAGTYAKSIGFDYAYRRFHADGYGKDYRILNLPNDKPETLHTYLSGAVLSFVQQRRYFDDHRAALRPYGVERPLWVFVGASVVGNLGKQGSSDVLAILQAFAAFLKEPDKTGHNFTRLLAGDALLTTSDGKNLFGGRFPYLESLDLDGDEAYGQMLRRVFNTSHPGKLRVVLRKGAEGELALQVGENPPFGLVNVGDASALFKLCSACPDLTCDEVETTHPLFDRLDSEEGISILIGAKKFIEGWNSWRVSALGLMNVGKSEGAQIIQLFGRGVRLRGYAHGLKRTSALNPPPPSPPTHLHLLETLNVFGVRADYMAHFSDMLRAEGAPAQDPEQIEIPRVLADPWPQGLKVIRLPEGVRFSRSERCSLRLPDADGPKPVALDWYPKVEAIASDGATGDTADASKNESPLAPKHIAFLDIDRLHAELVDFKRRRKLHNLEISRESVEALLLDPSWYTLSIPAERLQPTSHERVREWHEIALALLRTWCERLYRYEQSAWESPRLRYAELTPADPNIIDGYVVTADADSPLLEQLRELRQQLVDGEEPRVVERLQAVEFDRHVYTPLLALNEPTDLRVKPVALNDGERRFVKDLREWVSTDPAALEGRELHLLRNLSRGRGIGFFVAGNFYPDFLLWLTGPGDVQHILFVDPKGIVRLDGVTDPKIQFRRTIKDLERDMGDPTIRLSSFILSNTPYTQVHWHKGGTKAELQDLHILFQSDDSGTYISDMFYRAERDVLDPAT